MDFIKKIYIFLILFGVTIVIFVNMSAQAQTIVNFPDEKPSIAVVGHAEKEIPADQSKISIAVENTDNNANTARKNNADRMNTIITTLKKNGLTNENITTSNFEINPNYDYQNSVKNKIISYTALNKIILTTSVGTNISKFIDLAVNNGANRIEDIDFITSKKVINENFKDLLKEAFKDAKEQANILATIGGFSLSGVKKIEVNQDKGTSPFVNLGNRFALSSEKTPSPPTQIIPQKNKILVSLPVIFFINNQSNIQ